MEGGLVAQAQLERHGDSGDNERKIQRAQATCDERELPIYQLAGPSLQDNRIARLAFHAQILLRIEA